MGVEDIRNITNTIHLLRDSKYGIFGYKAVKIIAD